MTRLAAAALALVVLAACGGREPPFRWRDGAAALVEVRVKEELVPGRAARDVLVSARGVVEQGSQIALEIIAVRHDARDADGTVATVDTSTSAASPSERTAADAVIARVTERLVGRKVRLVFDGEDGLNAVAGMEEALAAAATTEDAAASDARDGFLPLLGDAPMLRSLRGAGLTRVPENFRDKSATIERRVEIVIPGRGVATCRMSGDAGFDHDGVPIVKWSGRLRADAETKGPPGDPPPPEVGDVVVAGVDAEGETQHDPGRATPDRGRITIRMPFARGASVVTTTTFLLTVDP